MKQIRHCIPNHSYIYEQKKSRLLTAKTVDQLLQLPFGGEEERHLVEYLKNSSEGRSQELLVMYYLQRAKFVEAIRLNQSLKQAALVSTPAVLMCTHFRYT